MNLEEQSHWVALRSHAGQVWLLDSTRRPKMLTPDQYTAYVWKHRCAYPIRWATDMKASESQSSTAAGSTLASLASFETQQDSPILPTLPSNSQDETPQPEATTENPPPSKKARTDETGGSVTAGFCEVLEIAEQISPERWAHG